MRYLPPFCALCLLLPQLSACNDQTITTAWAESPIIVDGRIEDWPETAITFFPDEELTVGAANDSANLYLILRFRNPSWARSIRMSGLSIWVNPENKKDRDIGVKFIGGAGLPDRQPPTGTEEPMTRRISPPPERFLFIEKERLAEVMIPTDGSMGPAAACDTSNGVFTYEFTLPWRASVAGSYGIAMTPGQKYAIGAEWGKMDDRREQMRGNGPPGGGMGGMPGGGPPGGMGGRPGGGMGRPGGQRPQIEEKEYWIKSETARPTTEE